LEAQADGTCVASGGEMATGSSLLQEEQIARTRFMRPRFYRLRVSRELKELTQDGGMFTDEVSAFLVPHVDPFYVFTDMAMAKRETITRGEWLTFAR